VCLPRRHQFSTEKVVPAPTPTDRHRIAFMGCSSSKVGEVFSSIFSSDSKEVSDESSAQVAATLAALNKYREAAKEDQEKYHDHANQVWWSHHDDQGPLWETTTQMKKFLGAVEAACGNSKWSTQCKQDLIGFCGKYRQVFEEWAENPYPEQGEEVEKRVNLAISAQGRTADFASSDGEFKHWTGYFMYCGE
jgi:hypothetical protein